MSIRKMIIPALIILSFLFLIGSIIYLLLNQETTNIINVNKKLDKVISKPTDSPQIIFSSQKFSDSNSGISFDFPVNWARPRVIRSDTNTQVVFNNSLEILVTTDASYKKKVKNKSNYTTIVLPVDESSQKNKVVVLTFKNSSNVDDSINEILDTLEVESEPQITPEPTPIGTTPLYPTSYPTSYPTPNPTTFYSENSQCAYGCLSENKFQ